MESKWTWLSARPVLWGFETCIETQAGNLSRNYSFNIATSVFNGLIGCGLAVNANYIFSGILGSLGSFMWIPITFVTYLIVMANLRRGDLVTEDSIEVRWTLRSHKLKRDDCAGIRWIFRMSPGAWAVLEMTDGSQIRCPILRNESGMNFAFGTNSAMMAFLSLSRQLGFETHQ